MLGANERGWLKNSAYVGVNYLKANDNISNKNNSDASCRESAQHRGSSPGWEEDCLLFHLLGDPGPKELHSPASQVLRL